MMKKIKHTLFILVVLQYQVLHASTNDSLKIDSLNELSLHLGSSFPDSSYKMAKIAFDKAIIQRNTQGQMTALMRMGRARKKKGDLDEALIYYEKAENIFLEKGEDSTFLAKIYIYQGIIYCHQDNFKKAKKRYYSAYKLVKSLKDYSLLIHCTINVVNLYNWSGEYKKAIEIGVQLIDDLPDTNYKAKGLMYLNIGNIYQNQDRRDEALSSFYKAKNCFSSISDDYNVCNSLHSIGNEYLFLEKYDTTLFFFEQAESIAIKKEFKGVLINIYEGKGEVYYSENRLDSALHYYRKSIFLSKANNNKSAQSIPLERIGDIFLERKKYQKALFLYLKSYKITQQFDSPRNLQIITNKISEAYEFIDKLDSALFYLRESNLYQDNISDEISASIEYENKYNREKHKVSELQSDLKNKDLKIKNQQLFLGTIIIVILIMLLLLFVLTSLIRQKKKNYKIEQKNLQVKKEIDLLIVEQNENEMNAMLDGQETERNRIATEIHDKLGGTLAVVKIYFQSMNKQIDRLKEENIIQFEKANELLDEACDEARKIAHDLSSGVISRLGLFVVVKNLKTKIEGAGQIKMEVNTYGTDDDIKMLNEIAIFRIIQELVSNILKHAKASEINVQLNVFDTLFNLIIEDDGQGFELDSMKDNTGMGLRGVEARVKKMNGTFSIDSSKDKGTTISIDIPLKEDKT